MIRYNPVITTRVSPTNGDTFHLVFIFIFAFLLRLGLVWYLLGVDWWYNSGEGYEHTMLADYVLSDQCYMPPGQYLFSGAVNQCFGHPTFTVLRCATILLSALLSVNIYRIGRDSFGRAAGIAAGYLSCMSLSFAFHSWTFYPTILAATLFSFFMVHFLRMLDCSGVKDSLLAGMFLGLSILTRSEMLLFLPLSLLWFFLVSGINIAKVLNGTALLIICIMIIGSWSYRNYRTCDRFVFISANAPVNYFIGNNPLQRGGYFPPHASIEQKNDYLLSGFIYNLKHPGWFVQFFSEKFKLCWSVRTGEHPLHLLNSKFEGSTVKLFNNSFEQTRLGATLANARFSGIYSHISSFYSILTHVFWFFVLSGVLSSHLFWRHSYFLLIICFSTTLVLAFFISGAQRLSLPMLPYCYLLMGLGVVFFLRLFRLSRFEVAFLIRRNALFLGAIIIAYCIWQGLLTYKPAVKYDTLQELYSWNVFSTEGESVRLIILESQLAYPVKKDALRRDLFSVRIGSYEIPHLEIAGTGRTEAKYYFKQVTDLLCENAIVINIPDALMGMLMQRTGSNNEGIKASKILEALQGEITFRYIPAWQFCSVIEKSCNYLLGQLTLQQAAPGGQRL